jgi:alpha-1,6-mannosyltransferase
VTSVLAAEEAVRRAAARARAERYDWPSAVSGMLTTLGAA